MGVGLILGVAVGVGETGGVIGDVIGGVIGSTDAATAFEIKVGIIRTNIITPKNWSHCLREMSESKVMRA